jgi:SIR2-like domain
MIDPLNSLAFSVYENKAVYCVLLGSGVSRAAEIPTGWEITLDLVRRVAALEGVTDQPNWSNWYKDANGKEPGYSDLLDQLAATPDERRSILHSYIEPDEDDIAAGRKVPTKAHRAIARLVQASYVRVILTTNFDHLMENALRDVGVEPTVIASEDALKGAVPLIHSRCYVVKLHGDYLDTRILNTETELSTYTSAMNGLLDRIIDEHGLILCGWSGDWDPASRAAIMRAPNRRYPTYWGRKR